MSICAACHLEIADRFILRVHPNLEFHASCLKCAECCRVLDESCTAFVRNGATYCREDYLRLFGTKCNRCDLPFDRSELVMRARHAVYHVACFSCVACERQLKTGDEFQIKGNSLYCRADCEAGNVPEPSSIPTPSMFANDDSWETSTMTSLDPTNSPPLSVRSPKSDDMNTPQHNNGFHNTSSGSSGGSSGKKKKINRVRTVLNEHQLSILKKCYALNSRPDALLKEQLVEMTALNARVIRVWFQNKRCKDKKRQIQMRDMAANAEKAGAKPTTLYGAMFDTPRQYCDTVCCRMQHCRLRRGERMMWKGRDGARVERALNGVRMAGVGPMIAGAPTNHVDQLSIGQPIDITHYAQWGQSMDTPMVDPVSYGPPPPPMAYTDIVPPPDLGGYGMMPPTGAFHEFSPHLHASDLSSPSCSE
ncbi:LIM domain protein [Necator americanus]|uniref:LIM domain protein n=1 Tax=Necator americanus TaxID=51031 RepID=W2TGI8_NECAM|nr:LIM domain protein [Necator americanus]ETN81160.1 LIM domain protein [Necator americanus]